MARIKDTSVEAVKAAADFVEVVSARTQLRKAGARYSGRCPFHEDRSPSFSVNAVDKLYYCFGCGAKGDLPRREIEILGPTGAKRIDTLVHDLVETSVAAGEIAQGDEVGAAMLSLRSFMFERVYLGPVTRPEHERAHATIRKIYAHRPDVDFIAGMTDRFALTYAEGR